MYCKNCGKEISEDSKFCQYCGANQEKESVEQKENKVITIPAKVKMDISEKSKKYIIWYVIWSALNLICWVCSEGNFSNYNDRDHFVPFYGDIMEYYDFSEFVVYVIAIPLIILCIKYLRDRKNKK